jgi:hypothetical protein
MQQLRRPARRRVLLELRFRSTGTSGHASATGYKTRSSVPFMAAAYQLPLLASRYNSVQTLSFLCTSPGLFLRRAGLAATCVVGAPANVVLSIVSPPA